MWARLILPDCKACDKRKGSWLDRLCEMCRVEIALLEEILAASDEQP
jgi:hypothetical protein